MYEGRGFNVVGAHAPTYNNKSVGICLIGDWQGMGATVLNFFFFNLQVLIFIHSETVPPANMLKATQDLIGHAIDKGFLSSNYTLLGHRQVRDTICPGPALFNEIKQWPNFGSDIVFENNNI